MVRPLQSTPSDFTYPNINPVCALDPDCLLQKGRESGSPALMEALLSASSRRGGSTTRNYPNKRIIYRRRKISAPYNRPKFQNLADKPIAIVRDVSENGQRKLSGHYCSQGLSCLNKDSRYENFRTELMHDKKKAVLLYPRQNLLRKLFPGKKIVFDTFQFPENITLSDLRHITYFTVPWLVIRDEDDFIPVQEQVPLLAVGKIEVATDEIVLESFDIYDYEVSLLPSVFPPKNL